MADRFIAGCPSITARCFSASPSDSTSRWTPCPPEYHKRWLQVRLGCIQLSLSCPFRPLHTFRLSPASEATNPAFGYSAPHLSARGTSTLLNNALLSAHFRNADNPLGTHSGCATLGLPEESCGDAYLPASGRSIRLLEPARCWPQLKRSRLPPRNPAA